MSEEQVPDSLVNEVAGKYLLLVLLCYVFIILAFLLAYSPLIPNEWWGPLAVVGNEFGFIRWTQIALRLYIALIPLFTTIALGLWWFLQLLEPDPPTTTRLYWATLIGCILALPFFFQLPLFMANISFDLEFSTIEARMLTLPIFLFTVLTYLLLLSTATSNHPLEYLKHLLLNPISWISFILLCLAAYPAFMGVILSALAGSEGIIYVPNFIQRLIAISLTTIPLAFLIPALLLSFTYPHYKENPLLNKKNRQ